MIQPTSHSKQDKKMVNLKDHPTELQSSILNYLLQLQRTHLLNIVLLDCYKEKGVRRKILLEGLLRRDSCKWQ